MSLPYALQIVEQRVFNPPSPFSVPKGKTSYSQPKAFLKGAAALGAKSSFTFWYGKRGGPTRKNALYLVVPRVMDRPLLSPLWLPWWIRLTSLQPWGEYLQLSSLSSIFHISYWFVPDFVTLCRADCDIRMSGHITWVGSSSAESSLQLDQLVDGQWRRWVLHPGYFGQ